MTRTKSIVDKLLNEHVDDLVSVQVGPYSISIELTDPSFTSHIEDVISDAVAASMNNPDVKHMVKRVSVG